MNLSQCPCFPLFAKPHRLRDWHAHFADGDLVNFGAGSLHSTATRTRWRSLLPKPRELDRTEWLVCLSTACAVLPGCNAIAEVAPGHQPQLTFASGDSDNVIRLNSSTVRFRQTAFSFWAATGCEICSERRGPVRCGLANARQFRLYAARCSLAVAPRSPLQSAPALEGLSVPVSVFFPRRIAPLRNHAASRDST